MISYMCIIQTKSVSVIVFEIIAIKALFDLSRSKVKSSKTCITKIDFNSSYMSVIQSKSVSVIVFEIIATKALFDLSRSKVKSSKTV